MYTLNSEQLTALLPAILAVVAHPAFFESHRKVMSAVMAAALGQCAVMMVFV